MRFRRETEWDEFKRSLRELDEGIRSMASIMNKGGSGTVWFGVRSDGEAVGLDVTEKTLRDVAQAIASQIKPQVYPRVTAVPIGDMRGREAVRVDFLGDDAPYSWKGMYFIRVADRDEQMDPDELSRAFRRKAERADPWDARASAKAVCDVDEKTLRDYVARGNACGRIIEPYTTATEVLSGLGLLRDGQLTNAADVLFCRSQGVRLKQGVLESHSRTNILDLQQESGTVFDLVHKADLYILNNTRRRIVIKGPGPRDEIPEIPREAVREALLNAYCHMDWAQRDFVVIDIYYDSVEILSAGWFIDGQDPERHLAGLDRDSTTRNELIARTLFRSKEIESYGSGLPRIKELCDAAGIRVEYQRRREGTLLVFHRNDAFAGMGGSIPPYGGSASDPVSDPVSDQATDPVVDQLSGPSDPIARLMTVLGEREMSTSELMGALGLTHRTNFRRNYLRPALEGGLIEMTLPDIPSSRRQRYRRVGVSND